MNEKTEKSSAPLLVYVLGVIAIAAAIALGIFTFAQNRASDALPTDDPAPVTISPSLDAGNDPVPDLGDAEIVDKPVTETAAPAETASQTNPPQTEPVKPTEQNADHNADRREEVRLTAPVDGMVSKAFSDSVPVYSLTMNDYRVHDGVDIEAEIGCAVYACAPGEITAVYEDPFMGTTVVVDHGSGLVSRYQNLAPQLPEGISAGVKVDNATVLGAVGESALAEMAAESHLHFVLTVDGAAVDPTEYIPLGSTSAVIE